MRFLFLALAFGAASTAAAAEPPNARAAYVERRGLIEADAQCRLFTPDIRSALQVGLAQARGALLRAGWTSANMRSLENAAVGAARARSCSDERTAAAAEDARLAFSAWINRGAMEFPGWERPWRAHRAADENGWRLSQPIDTPRAATFGVRQHDGVQQLTLVVPLSPREAPPTSAQLVMRDTARAGLREIALTQRVALGLEAGLPSPRAATAVPSTRAIERSGGRRHAVFTFPDSAFADLLALDPRETVELRLTSGRSVQRLYIEVGDIAAARAFLTIR